MATDLPALLDQNVVAAGLKPIWLRELTLAIEEQAAYYGGVEWIETPPRTMTPNMDTYPTKTWAMFFLGTDSNPAEPLDILEKRDLRERYTQAASYSLVQDARDRSEYRPLQISPPALAIEFDFNELGWVAVVTTHYRDGGC